MSLVDLIFEVSSVTDFREEAAISIRMSALKFAKEFTELISRWKRPAPSNGEGEQDKPLSNEELVKTIQNVLEIMVGVNLRIADHPSVKSPATKIDVCSPKSPIDFLGESYGNLTRFKSLDFLASSNTFSNGLSGTDEPSMNQERTKEDEKPVSRSSPAIHVSAVERADTFIKEETKKDASNGVENQTKGQVSPKISILCDLKKITKDIIILHTHVADVVKKISNTNEELYSPKTKRIERLPSFGRTSSQQQISTLRPLIPQPKLRRSSTGVAGAPASPKLNTIHAPVRNVVTGRKTITGSTLRSSKISSSNPSIATTSTVIKKSPLGDQTILKNRKYAHVQSTIPKVVDKRKNT